MKLSGCPFSSKRYSLLISCKSNYFLLLTIIFLNKEDLEHLSIFLKRKFLNQLKEDTSAASYCFHDLLFMKQRLENYLINSLVETNYDISCPPRTTYVLPSFRQSSRRKAVSKLFCFGRFMVQLEGETSISPGKKTQQHNQV